MPANTHDVNQIFHEHYPWSECHLASELALLIDSIPHSFRVSIIRSALWPSQEDSIRASYLVGEVRSLLVDAFPQLFGRMVTYPLPQLPELEELVRAFSGSQDPAQVQLLLCDFFETLASATAKGGTR